MYSQSNQRPAGMTNNCRMPNIDIITNKQRDENTKQPIAARNSEIIVGNMSLKEKVGQKIILDFRHWQEDEQIDVKPNMIQLSETIKNILKAHHISGVILFSANLNNITQIKKLTADLGAISSRNGMGLFIATDNEGGSIFRLPRDEFSAFAGNMALGAVYEGTKDPKPAYVQGRFMARDLISLGINTNFAPVMDVNSNPNNPVINIRSFGDNPASVGLLARTMISGFHSAGIVSVGKHFPGHGNTAADSHHALPLVNHNRQSAEATDLAPYRTAITAGAAPDMIMTAHIQYPALDDKMIKDKNGMDIIVPATLSKKIQTDLLRNDMGYRGVTITDALDMGAISHHFAMDTCLEHIFSAGVDIALMPIRLCTAGDVPKLVALIENITDKIRSGQISERTITESVMRIVNLKLQRNILPNPPAVIPFKRHLSEISERSIAKKSITLLKNIFELIPILNKDTYIYILMPSDKQHAKIKQTFINNGYHPIGLYTGKTNATAWDEQQQKISRCNVLIIGSLSLALNNSGASSASNNEAKGEANIRRAIHYAKQMNKRVIHITLGAPYDVVNYDDLTDAVLATYSPDPDSVSLGMATEVIIGRYSPQGKLPVNIYSAGSRGDAGDLRYPRGFGMTLNH